MQKVTIDNSVNYNPQTEQTRERERDSKPKTVKSSSLRPKQKEKHSQNNRNIIAKMSTEGFETTK